MIRFIKLVFLRIPFSLTVKKSESNLMKTTNYMEKTGKQSSLESLRRGSGSPFFQKIDLKVMPFLKL